MSDFKLVFVHGYTATPEADWYPALGTLLQAANIDFVVPALPGDEYPHADEWLPIIDREVRSADKPVFLVGHSLGTRAILLYLEKYTVEIEKVLLIAAFNNDPVNGERRDEHYADFFTHVIDLEMVKSKVKDGFIVLHSRDDDDIPITQSAEIARQLDAKFIDVDGHEHFYQPQDAPLIFQVLMQHI